MPTRSPGAGQLSDRLGYLFKHATEGMRALNNEALAPFEVDGRTLAILLVVAGAQSSQLEVARRLGIDRTSMVALLDDLEGRGLVERRQDAHDRRRNSVLLTDKGRRVLDGGTAATIAAEDRFLARLTVEERDELRRLLRLAVAPNDEDRDLA
jgi:DNA-binding MarR family transcriptional regulator